jgi:hypothetical protein
MIDENHEQREASEEIEAQVTPGRSACGRHSAWCRGWKDVRYLRHDSPFSARASTAIELRTLGAGCGRLTPASHCAGLAVAGKKCPNRIITPRTKPAMMNAR